MKQKVKNTNSITQQQLLNILKNLPTKNDMNERFNQQDLKIEERFRKQDLRFDERFNQQETKLETKLGTILEDKINKLEKLLLLRVDLRLAETEEKLLTNITKFKDLILTTVDPLLQELETRREDREIQTAWMQDIRNHLDDHEKKIKKLQMS